MAAEVVLEGQTVDKGAEADTLHGAERRTVSSWQSILT